MKISGKHERGVNGLPGCRGAKWAAGVMSLMDQRRCRFFAGAMAGAALWLTPTMFQEVLADTPSGEPIDLESTGVLDPPTEEEVRAMLNALSDVSFEKRQRATVELWQLGEEVLPALKKVAGGKDPEVAARASELMLYISAGVLFDSSDEVKALVLKFSRGNTKTKVEILGKLTELGQWKQVLHLAGMEKDPEVQERLSGVVRKTASRAAREAVIDGDLELASEILQLSGDGDQALVVRAWFYSLQGKYEEELAKARELSGKKGSQWRLALHRAHGNLDGALKEVKSGGSDGLGAQLQVLVGNPGPLLLIGMDDALQDAVLARACQIQQARLQSDRNKADMLARDLERMAVNEDVAGSVVSGLAANGYRDAALKLMERFDKASVFEYYDSTESPEKALAALGIPKDSVPPYTDWVKAHSEQLLEDEDKEGYLDMLLLAGFLVRHGEAEHASAVLEPLMKGLEDDGADIWFDLIEDMPLFELGTQAVDLLIARGNEDGEIDLGVRHLVDTSKQSDTMWAWLKKRNDGDADKSLRQIALLAGLLKDQDGATAALHQELVDEAGKGEGELQDARYLALFTFAIKRHELATASTLVDQIAQGNERWQQTKLFLDTALLRWQKVEPAYEALEAQDPGNYNNLVKWAMVLRKLGQAQKAREVLDRALVLTMGDLGALNTIALNLSNAGYSDEAWSLWKRVAMMSEAGEADYDRSILYMANYSSPEKSGASWKIHASIAEVYAGFTMRGRGMGSTGGILNARFKADFYRGMDYLTVGKKKEGVKLLGSSCRLNPGSGVLADEFFPALRGVGVQREYDQWFDETYQHVAAACERFPRAHNSHNTAAWLASRSLRRLDDALRHAEAAVSLRPNQGAYLDTMAEVWFARGNRKKAIEWSDKAVAVSISHAQGAPRAESMVLNNYYELTKQRERFKHGKMPKVKKR